MSKLFCGAEGRDHQKPPLSRTRTTSRLYKVSVHLEMSQPPFASLLTIQVASLERWVLNTHYYVSVGRQDKQKLKTFTDTTGYIGKTCTVHWFPSDVDIVLHSLPGSPPAHLQNSL